MGALGAWAPACPFAGTVTNDLSPGSEPGGLCGWLSLDGRAPGACPEAPSRKCQAVTLTYCSSDSRSQAFVL